MKSGELSAVIVPVITPVDDDDRVDEGALRKVIRYLIDAGVDALFVCGSTGEGPLLTEEQWTRAVETAFDENKDRVPLLAGVADTSTKRILPKIRKLADMGYPCFVVAPTFYLSLRTADEHLRLFGECKNAGGAMQMIAYNIPSCTGSNISIETMCEMTRRGWIRYCKDSSGDMEYLKRLISEGKRVGLEVLIGAETCIVEGLLAGGRGIVPMCANYEPQTFIRTYEAAMSKDTAELSKMQERIMFLRERMPKGGPSWIAGVKYAMATLGMGSGKPVSPLQPAGPEQRKKIDKLRG